MNRLPRAAYPPHDFVCQYQDHCPHLEGMSATWVMEEYRRGEDTDHEELRIIEVLDERLEATRKRIRELEREVAELRAKYQALHQKQFKPNRKKSPPCEERVPGKKKRGAPVGHPGWFRLKPKEIDHSVEVPAPQRCPHCGSTDLTAIDESVEHLQEDIVLVPRPAVTRYVHGQAFCKHCRKTVVQAAADEILHAPIGPVAKAVAMYLRYDVCIPYRKVVEIFRVLFGLSCVPASLVGFDQKAAKMGEGIYQDVREKLRASPIAHADETSWRNDGVGHYVWFGGNENIAFFHIDRHRSAQVAKTIFGDFPGTLVRDRYAAYNGIGANWQACLAHIITTVKEINREHALLPQDERDENVDSFTNRVKDLCSKACDIGQQLKSGDLSYKSALRIEKRFLRGLKSICKQPLRFKPAQTLRAYLTGPEHKNLFTFLRIPGVPPTNNHAEQSLRKMVIFRKVCFGTRSLKGIKSHSIIPSLVQTAKRQGAHPLTFLKTLLTTDAATAQAALYKNSS
ncbi:MAG: IS66 family transposase [Pseudomonadota bacterium]